MRLGTAQRSRTHEPTVRLFWGWRLITRPLVHAELYLWATTAASWHVYNVVQVLAEDSHKHVYYLENRQTKEDSLPLQHSALYPTIPILKKKDYLGPDASLGKKQYHRNTHYQTHQVWITQLLKPAVIEGSRGQKGHMEKSNPRFKKLSYSKDEVQGKHGDGGL